MKEVLLLELQMLGQLHQKLVQALQRLGLVEMQRQMDCWLVLVVVVHQS